MVSYGGNLFAAKSYTAGPQTTVYQVTPAGVVSVAYNDVVHSASFAVGHGVGGGLGIIANTSSFAPDLISGWLYSAITGTWGTWDLSYAGTRIAQSPFIWYKGRPYVVPNSATPIPAASNIVYGEIGQIQGVLTNGPFNGGQLFKFGAAIKWFGSFSISSDTQSVEYFAFGNAYGEVLVYAGDNPGADNWYLVGRLKIPSPFVGRTYDSECTFAYENDTLIFTLGGIVSLKALFLNKDKIGIESSGYISISIEPYWAKLLKSFPSSTGASLTGRNISAALHENDRAIYFLVQGWINEDGTTNTSASTIFIYNLNDLSWNLHKITAQTTTFGSSSGPGNVCYCAGDIYFWTNQYIMKLDTTSWLDQQVTGGFANVGYDFAIHGAPTTFDDSVATKKIEGYEPIIKQPTPRCGWGIKLSTDFGRKESGTVAPAQTTEFAKRMYSAGIEGTFFQYKLEGNTATTSGTVTTSGGLDLYAINAFYKKGGIL
jgi:hypothetical protein